MLEPGSVKLLRDAGVGQRMDREGHAHDGSWIAWQDREPFLINTKAHCGKPMASHGQTAITEEFYRVRERDGGPIVDEAENVRLYDLTGSAPKVAYEKDGETARSHATSSPAATGSTASRAAAFPARALKTFERAYPFGWLGSCRKRRRSERSSTPGTSAASLLPRCAIRCSAATTSSAVSTPTSPTGRTTGSGTSSSGGSRPRSRTRS